jgi:hypothetical protein
VPDYLISQHDPRGERSEQMAAVKAAYTYDMLEPPRWRG